jgi:hypothetical protein
MIGAPVVVDHGFERWIRLCAIAGAAGLGIWIVGALFVGAPAVRSYLVAYMFWVGIALGSLSITMLHHLTGGAWGLLIRRPMEAAAMTLPLFAVLFLPIAVGLSTIYPWARTSGDVPHLGHKAAFLNTGFFVTRAVVYFIIWSGLAWIMGRASRAQDATRDQTISNRMKMLSGPGLGLVFLSGTFMAIDWGMSLEPDWTSTMYPPMIIVGQGLATFATMIALATWLAPREPLARIVTPGRFQDLGNLLLAFVMLWAYLSFSQFLIIWSGNLREEIPWYTRRIYGGWQFIAIALIFCQFFLPFFALLMRATKRTPRSLAMVALFVVTLHYVDLHWLVKPAAAWPNKQANPIWWAILASPLDVAAWVGIGGLAAAAFLWLLRQAPIVPLNDHAMLALEEASGHVAEGGHGHA